MCDNEEVKKKKRRGRESIRLGSLYLSCLVSERVTDALASIRGTCVFGMQVPSH